MAIPKHRTPEAAPAPPPSAGGLLALGRPAAPEQIGGSARLASRPNVPFFLRHHPSAWEVGEVDGVATFLPVLGRHALAPGAAGIRLRPRSGGAPDHQYARAHDRAAREGWVYLDPQAPIEASLLPEGLPPGGYLREYPCADPRTEAAGVVYEEAWRVPVQSLPGEAQRWRFDAAAYDRWRAHLVSSGQLAAPLPGIMDALRDRAQSALDGARANLGGVAAEVREHLIAPRIERAERAAKAVAP